MNVNDVLHSLKGKRTNKLSLRFVDPDMETLFSKEKEKQSGAAFCCSCVVLLFTAVMEALIDPWSVYNHLLMFYSHFFNAKNKTFDPSCLTLICVFIFYFLINLSAKYLSIKTVLLL